MSVLIPLDIPSDPLSPHHSTLAKISEMKEFMLERGGCFSKKKKKKLCAVFAPRYAGAVHCLCTNDYHIPCAVPNFH